LEAAVRNPELCREDEIVTMVHRFYASVRGDPLIGHVFEAHVADWDHHLAKMCDFWSSVLLGTTRYRGTPMPTHAKLPDLSPALFRRWLQLFHATTRTLGNDELQQKADALAERIAQSLWYGYQLFNVPGELPEPIPAV
jgi:hemoglobin